jgi:hypothetical protein
MLKVSWFLRIKKPEFDPFKGEFSFIDEMGISPSQ